MRRAIAAIAVAAAAALASAQPAAAQSVVPLPSVRLQTSVSTGPHLFGDRMEARLDLFVDRDRADPSTLRVDTNFFPYDRVGPPRRTQARDGSVSRISYAYTLDCLTLRCFPGIRKRQIRVAFPVAVVRYRERSGTPRGLAVKWPTFRLISRLPPLTQAQIRANVPPVVPLASPVSQLFAPVAVPAATYRLSPALLAALLAAAGLLALALAAVLARPVVAYVRAAAQPEEGPTLTSLERALERVEVAAARNGHGDREALAWLARELRQTGLHDLMRQARRLAWSEHEPTADESLDLARQVRAALEPSA